MNPSKKQAIINAALTLLEKHPIEEVTMRMVAKQANMTTGAIYYYYKNKEDLFFEVMKTSLLFTHKLYDTIKTSNTKQSGETLLQTINKEVEKRLKKSKEQALHISLLGDMIKRQHSIKEKYQENYELIIDHTSELINDAYELQDNLDSKAVASLLVGAMDGIAIQQALNILPVSQEKIIDTFITFFNQSIEAYLKEYKK